MSGNPKDLPAEPRPKNRRIGLLSAWLTAFHGERGGNSRFPPARRLQSLVAEPGMVSAAGGALRA